MTVSHFAGLPVSETMWAEVENEVAVVWKCPQPEVNKIAELIYRFDVRICSPDM